MNYLQIIDGYITDCITYAHGEYVPHDGNAPPDILCGCYQLVDGAIVADADKYAAYLAAAEADRPPEPTDPVTALEMMAVDHEYRLILLELGV